MSITVTRTPQELYVEVSVLNSLPIRIVDARDNVIHCRAQHRCHQCSYYIYPSCYDERKRDSDKIFTIIKNKYPELLL